MTRLSYPLGDYEEPSARELAEDEAEAREWYRMYFEANAERDAAGNIVVNYDPDIHPF
jgi:hypothetical protein